MNRECESYRSMMETHTESIVRRSEEMNEEQWKWRPSISAPNAEETVRHALAWMVSDRKHLEECADIGMRQVSVPSSQSELLAEFKKEAEVWINWLSQADEKELSKKVKRYGIFPMPKRFYVGHALQNLIYKSGQLSVLFFAQGLDGDTAFTAPMPQDILEIVDSILSEPLIQAVVNEDLARVEKLLSEGADADATSFQNMTALHFATANDNQEMVDLLLASKAHINAQNDEGATPLISAVAAGSGRMVRILLWNGADATLADKAGKTALDYARESGDPEVISICESGLQIGR